MSVLCFSNHRLFYRSYDTNIRSAYKVDESSSSQSESSVHKDQLTPAQTVHKLLRIVNDDSYKSGGRIDYFDDE